MSVASCVHEMILSLFHFRSAKKFDKLYFENQIIVQLLLHKERVGCHSQFG